MGMMGTFVLLATEESGFGLNFDILDTNLINLSILIGILFYFGKGVVGNILSERQTKIAEAIKDAEERQKTAAAALADQQQNLAKAQAEAEKIRQEAQERAKVAKATIASQAEQDIERLKSVAAQDLSSAQERAIAELKQRVATMALERVETQLSDRLDEGAQQQLIDRSIAQLGGN